MRKHDNHRHPDEPAHQRGRGKAQEKNDEVAGEKGQHLHGHHGPRGRGPGGSAEAGRRGFGRGGGGGGRRRAQRGDVRTAILLLLADQPMHGYQLMQAMSDRTNGAWKPSPGAVYPTIEQLKDEGLATIEQEGGRRLVTLTPEGQAHLAEHGGGLSDPFADFADGAAGPDLREPAQQLHAAARLVATSGNPAQVEAAAKVLADARRSLYLILAGQSDGADT